MQIVFFANTLHFTLSVSIGVGLIQDSSLFLLTDKEKKIYAFTLILKSSFLIIWIKWQHLLSSWRGYFWHLLTFCPHLDWLRFWCILVIQRFHLILFLGLVSIFPWISSTPFLFFLDFFFIWLKCILNFIVVLQKIFFAETLMYLYECWKGT